MQIQQDIAQVSQRLDHRGVELERLTVGGFGFRQAPDRAQHHAEIRQDGGIRRSSDRTLQQCGGRCRVTLIESDDAEDVQCGRIARILCQQMFGKVASVVRVACGIDLADVSFVVVAPPPPQGAIRRLELSRQSGRIAQRRGREARAQFRAQPRQCLDVGGGCHRACHITIDIVGDPVVQPDRVQDRGAEPADSRPA